MKNCIIKKIPFICLVLAVSIPSVGRAGNLDSPAEPDHVDSAMYSIEAIFERLNSGTEGTQRGTGFLEPTAGPGATGHSLDEVMSVAPLPNAVNAADPDQVMEGKVYWGLTPSDWGTQTGNALPGGGRFADNGDGTVTDNQTNLVWLKNANCDGSATWGEALDFANNLQDGDCGLSDNSGPGNWRLPQIQELRSLVNRGGSSPALPPGALFTQVELEKYWSSTTLKANDTNSAWFVDFDDGVSKTTTKDALLFVLPVRDAL